MSYFFSFFLYPEAATRGVLHRKMFLEISQNSQENMAHVFSCEFCGVSKNTFLQNTSGRLFLYISNDFLKNCTHQFWRVFTKNVITKLVTANSSANVSEVFFHNNC